MSVSLDGSTLAMPVNAEAESGVHRKRVVRWVQERPGTMSPTMAPHTPDHSFIGDGRVVSMIELAPPLGKRIRTVLAHPGRADALLNIGPGRDGNFNTSRSGTAFDSGTGHAMTRA
jgi:hypothetical protein